MRSSKINGGQEYIGSGFSRPAGIHLMKSGTYQPVSNACSNQNGACHHLCLARPGGRTCSCQSGWRLQDDDVTCRPLALVSPSIIWTRRDESTGTNFVEMLPGNSTTIRASLGSTVTAKHLFRVNPPSVLTGLDFDVRNQQMFWTDAGLKAIHKVDFLNEASITTILKGTSSAVQGLAADWLNQNLYYTDAYYNWIGLFNTNSSHRHVVVQTGLDRPQGIAVHPSRGQIFWSDWGREPKIERATLSGQDRAVLVSNNIQRPHGMAIDYVRHRLYWADSELDIIGSLDLDGGTQGVYHYSPGTKYYDIAFDGMGILATEQLGHKLHVIVDGDDVIEAQLTAEPHGVGFYHESRQQWEETDCQVNNGGCQHTCVGDPTGHRCLCLLGYSLGDDNHTCTEDGGLPSVALLFSSDTGAYWLPHDLADIPQDVLSSVSLGTLISGMRILAMDLNYADPRPPETPPALLRPSPALLSPPPAQKPAPAQEPALARKPQLIMKYTKGGKMLFYTRQGVDSTQEIYRRSLLNDPNDVSRLVYTGGGNIEGISVDWVASNVYWTDRSHGNIQVSRLDGSFRKTIVSGLDQPLGVAVHPREGLLFWTETGAAPRVARATLAGTETRTLLVFGVSVAQPKELAIDFLEDRIYWVDGFHGTVQSCDVDGQNLVSYPPIANVDLSGITIYKDYVIMTDSDNQRLIFGLRQHDGQFVVHRIVSGLGTRPHNVRMYDGHEQLSHPGPCDEDNGGTSNSDATSTSHNHHYYTTTLYHRLYYTTTLYYCLYYATALYHRLYYATTLYHRFYYATTLYHHLYYATTLHRRLYYATALYHQLYYASTLYRRLYYATTIHHHLYYTTTIHHHLYFATTLYCSLYYATTLYHRFYYAKALYHRLYYATTLHRRLHYATTLYSRLYCATALNYATTLHHYLYYTTTLYHRLYYATTVHHHLYYDTTLYHSLYYTTTLHHYLSYTATIHHHLHYTSPNHFYQYYDIATKHSHNNHIDGRAFIDLTLTATDSEGTPIHVDGSVSLPGYVNYDPGTQHWEFRAADKWGRTTTCSFDVTILDAHPPTILDCPGNITMVTAADGVTVTWDAPRAVDNSGRDVTLAASKDPGSRFFFSDPEHVVTYTARDIAGNTATCDFWIKLKSKLFLCASSTCLEEDLPIVSNGVFGACAVSDGVKICPVVCNAGLSPSSQRIRCQPDGQWEGGVYVCIRGRLPLSVSSSASFSISTAPCHDNEVFLFDVASNMVDHFGQTGVCWSASQNSVPLCETSSDGTFPNIIVSCRRTNSRGRRELTNSHERRDLTNSRGRRDLKDVSWAITRESAESVVHLTSQTNSRERRDLKDVSSFNSRENTESVVHLTSDNLSNQARSNIGGLSLKNSKPVKDSVENIVIINPAENSQQSRRMTREIGGIDISLKMKINMGAGDVSSVQHAEERLQNVIDDVRGRVSSGDVVVRVNDVTYTADSDSFSSTEVTVDCPPDTKKQGNLCVDTSESASGLSKTAMIGIGAGITASLAILCAIAVGLWRQRNHVLQRPRRQQSDLMTIHNPAFEDPIYDVINDAKAMAPPVPRIPLDARKGACAGNEYFENPGPLQNDGGYEVPSASAIRNAPPTTFMMNNSQGQEGVDHDYSYPAKRNAPPITFMMNNSQGQEGVDHDYSYPAKQNAPPSSFMMNSSQGQGRLHEEDVVDHDYSFPAKESGPYQELAGSFQCHHEYQSLAGVGQRPRYPGNDERANQQRQPNIVPWR
ncbi:LRP6 [Branchiostoma lanceolatum]|uniref:LRP6 protein n=1 Tax=Branchiostoma lanceolatum TaxID=7740 RepID=A0A8K0EAV1_BRALA|nr:LRP6 [Branchiostoma lanceolatum]